MATKEEDFKQRFAAVIKDMQQNGSKDNEAMWLIGSLAARLIDAAGKKSWAELKSSLAPTDVAQLLRDFEKNGNALHAEGKKKPAYAVQALAVSLIARTQSDPEVRAGNTMFDEMINQTVQIYRANKHLDPQAN